MNMRHNELYINENNESVIKSKTMIGRYSLWSDHSDVKFSDVYGKENFEFKPDKIIFLVPLWKKDLFFLRTENPKGIISEQFMYCAQSEKIPKENFSRWFSELALNSLVRSISFWALVLFLIFGKNVLFAAAILAVPNYLIVRRNNKRYLIERVLFFETIAWVGLGILSFFST
jgi:hypothetical protein